MTLAELFKGCAAPTPELLRMLDLHAQSRPHLPGGAPPKLGALSLLRDVSAWPAEAIPPHTIITKPALERALENANGRHEEMPFTYRLAYQARQRVYSFYPETAVRRLEVQIFEDVVYKGKKRFEGGQTGLHVDGNFSGCASDTFAAVAGFPFGTPVYAALSAAEIREAGKQGRNIRENYVQHERRTPPGEMIAWNNDILVHDHAIHDLTNDQLTCLFKTYPGADKILLPDNGLRSLFVIASFGLRHDWQREAYAAGIRALEQKLVIA